MSAIALISWDCSDCNWLIHFVMDIWWGFLDNFGKIYMFWFASMKVLKYASMPAWMGMNLCGIYLRFFLCLLYASMKVWKYASMHAYLVYVTRWLRLRVWKYESMQVCLRIGLCWLAGWLDMMCVYNGPYLHTFILSMYSCYLHGSIYAVPYLHTCILLYIGPLYGPPA